MENTIMYKEILESTDKIKDCFEANKDTLELLGEKIREFNPKNVVIAARGTSLHSAYYAKYLFEIYYGIPVSMASPSVFTVYDDNLKLEDSLVIAISQSGGAKDITTVIEKARSIGAMTLAITNEPNSITAKASEYNLYCNVGKAVAYAASKTYTSTMYLVTKLVHSITNDSKVNIDEDKLTGALKLGLTYEDTINELVKDLKDTEDLFVLSRGLDLSLACELALKIKETNHFHVSSYPTSEFYHGPIIMVNEKTPVIVFGIDNHIVDDTVKMINELESIGTYTLTITNDKPISEASDKTIFIDEKDDLYALFTAIIILQLYCCSLAVLRGNSTDYMKTLEHIDTF